VVAYGQGWDFVLKRELIFKTPLILPAFRHEYSNLRCKLCTCGTLGSASTRECSMHATMGKYDGCLSTLSSVNHDQFDSRSPCPIQMTNFYSICAC
jgi:hypothetical protein